MTKSQLVDRISQRAPHVPKREVEAIVKTVFDTMVDALRRNERIEIRGFGSFAVKSRSPREGRNPKTGQRVKVPKRRTAYFTVGKELRDRINPSSDTVQVNTERVDTAQRARVPVAYRSGPSVSEQEPMGAAPAHLILR